MKRESLVSFLGQRVIESRTVLSLLASSIVISFVCVSGGCSQAPSGDGFKGERGQVSGTITLDGQALAKGCQVIFMNEQAGYTASGIIGENGQYRLIYSGGKGLPTGDYMAQLSAPLVAESNQASDPVAMAGKMKLGANTAAAETGPFPVKYASTSTSNLRFKVEPNQNTADFKLEKN